MRFVMLVLVAVVSTSGQAPTGPSTVGPKSITFDHNGRNTTGYALYAKADGGLEQRIDLGLVRPDRAGRVRIRLPQLPAGTYEFAIVAYNASGESSRIRATPARVLVDTMAPPAGDSTQPAGAPHPGALGRLWRIVIGSDN